jgi:hypothetical protein
MAVVANMVDHHHIDLRLSSNEALRIANRGRHDPWLAILLLFLQNFHFFV